MTVASSLISSTCEPPSSTQPRHDASATRIFPWESVVHGIRFVNRMVSSNRGWRRDPAPPNPVRFELDSM